MSTFKKYNYKKPFSGGNYHKAFRKKFALMSSPGKSSKDVKSITAIKMPVSLDNTLSLNDHNELNNHFRFVRGASFLKRYIFLLHAAGFEFFSNNKSAKKLKTFPDLSALVKKRNGFHKKTKRKISEQLRKADFALLTSAEVKEYSSLKVKISSLEKASIAFNSKKQLKYKSYTDNELVYCVCLRFFEEKGLNAKVKDYITTQNSNALSWVLGKGLVYFLNTDLKTIKKDFKLNPEAMKYIHEIKDILVQSKSILEFTNSEHFSDQRKVIAGDLDSWLSNFQTAFKKIEDDTKLKQYLDYLEQVASYEALTSLEVILPHSENALNRFVDSWNNLKPIWNIKVSDFILKSSNSIETGYNYLYSEINAMNRSLSSIVNFAVQRLGEDITNLSNEDIKLLKSFSRIKINDKLLPKLNSFGGAGANIIDSIEQNAILYKACINAIIKTSESTFRSLSDLTFKEYCDRYSLDSIQGYRHFIARYLKTCKLASPKTHQRLKNYLISVGSGFEKKHINRHLYEGKGAFYLSKNAKAKSRHTEYDISLKSPMETVFRKLLIKLIGECDSLSSSLSSGYLFNHTDYLELSGTLLDISFKTSKAVVVKNTILNRSLISIQGLSKYFVLNEEGLLSPNEFKSLHARSIISIIKSKALWLAGKLLTNDVKNKVITTKIGFHDIYLVPKDKMWNLKERTIKGKGPIGQFFRNNKLKDTSINLFSFDPKLLSFKFNNAKEFLTQAPFDLYVELPFGTDERISIKAGKDLKKDIQLKKHKTNKLAKLNIPLKNRTQILKAILGLDNSVNNEAHFVFEYNYTSTIDLTGKKPKVGVELDVFQPFITMPVTLTTKLTKGKKIEPKNVLGIDLGETGFGFSVINIKSKKVVHSGKFKVTSLMKLASIERNHRKFKQVKASKKFTESKKLINIRDAAVGDMTFLINRLLNEFDAIPVFEAQIKNLESGSRRVKSIYEKLTKLYTFSNIDAHKADRSHFWLGATNWQTKTITNLKDARKDKNLFPGGVVNAARTSQICHKCGCSPIELLQNSPLKEFKINDKGLLKIDKTNLLFGKSFSDKVYDQTSVIKLSRSLLRKKSNAAKDTSQSVYRCLNASCANTMDADENAAINIGRRFLV